MANNEGPSPLTARAEAIINAVLSSPERNILIFVIAFLILILCSIAFEIWHPTLLAKISFGFGIVGIAILILWFIFSKRSITYEGSLTNIALSPDSASVQTPAHNLPEVITLFVTMVTLFRSVAQGGNPPPSSYGSVDNGEPQKNEGLREYSEEERKCITQNTLEDIKKEERRIIQEAIKQLVEIRQEQPAITPL